MVQLGLAAFQGREAALIYSLSPEQNALTLLGTPTLSFFLGTSTFTCAYPCTSVERIVNIFPSCVHWVSLVSQAQRVSRAGSVLGSSKVWLFFFPWENPHVVHVHSRKECWIKALWVP